MRELDCWAGDGQSTRLWAFIVEAVGGSAFSLDIDPKACVLARKTCGGFVSVVETDSITYLAQCVDLGRLDLLYLDRFDYTGDARSALHHAGELAAAYPKLPSGCRIAVDDCHTPTEGKHTLVKAYFDAMGIEPELASYVTVWRKP